MTRTELATQIFAALIARPIEKRLDRDSPHPHTEVLVYGEPKYFVDSAFELADRILKKAKEK